ncbi:helicase-exonuclease AddAB subunit AddA [Anaerosacchariphilus polymeriproducens]|uniref:ATP-dependent helicase/nuclease subunit A n=1 Tax=Anaerosacchariphilus polymeriproducens TaxID=1812858 RepID=A0A371AUW7_9FIRM|nr:helicase-exonuclease AddAB subunit AddA [Anaerosacchariphilus polymeriproducens]RDU23368.1 helicase-exonuclease AddAB subunit AddA [Anaerosacchariphilus polymeriproducens]
MAVSWTKEQEKVISLRDRNILVSAAAGSGKTAVLVERIISMITSAENPIDIDRLLIVTFTNAAAAEMKERIGKAIEKKLEAEPDNAHCQRQLTLIHNAQITTIHSFCLFVIRNHFHKIDLSPDFRMGDEGELKLIKSDVLDSLLEDSYLEKREEFLNFIEAYGGEKSDAGIKDLILQLFEFSVSYPWPLEWLESCKKEYQTETFEQMEESPWMNHMLDHVRRECESMKQLLMEALDIITDDDGPYMYKEALSGDLEQLESVLESNTYEEYDRRIKNISFLRLSTKKDDSVDELKKQMVKDLRDQFKNLLKNLRSQYFFQSPEEILKDMQGSRAAVEELVYLTITFSKRFAVVKEEKNLLDFNDLEHFALNILIDKNTKKPTEIATEFSEYFHEILIDEYQDSNYVQELLLSTITKESLGKKNLFMVGDVKQSIYRFRLARPELFLSKFNRYSFEESLEQRIDLDKNFRSRSQVLEGINFIFYQIMSKAVGNIDYNERTALYPGSEFPPNSEKEANDTQVILVGLSKEDEKEIKEEGITLKEIEARAIAAKIRELVHPITGMDILEESGNSFRKARYHDIVILLRTISGWADTFVEVLAREGIPAHTTSGTGYFSALEIQVILNLLKIIDNPRQEIPMTAVLSSPIVGLNAQELAQIKIAYREEPIYEAFFRICEEDGELKERLYPFYEMLKEFRTMLSYTPIHDLLCYILEKTGYKDFVSAMPGGQQRKANVEMLIEKAIAFENTSYKGLFHFVRYIEQLQKYDVDFGEASILDENEDTVRIMSIHKSKGLEFPIVFAAGMGKRFNEQDAKKKVILHPDLGIGIDYIDTVLRIKSPTLLKKVLARQTVLENLGEELRILYVALTRAKEKLILTGGVSDYENLIRTAYFHTKQKEISLSFSVISKAKCYFDWIVPALIRHRGFKQILSDLEYEIPVEHPLFHYPCEFQVKIVNLEEVFREEISLQLETKASKEMFLEKIQFPDTNILEQVKSRLHYCYPYDKETEIQSKISVSELKKRYQEDEVMDQVQKLETLLLDEQWEEEFVVGSELEPIIPKFMKREETISGAARGTAYHKVMESLNFSDISDLNSIKKQMEQLLSLGKIDQETIGMVNPFRVYEFFQSNLGKRMQSADKRGKLRKEQPFVMGLKACEIYPGIDSDELILVQGIIDAYFEEDGKLILMDYKTDYVTKKEELIQKYKIQIDLYKKALNRADKKQVEESIIYSFALQEEISL